MKLPFFLFLLIFNCLNILCQKNIFIDNEPVWTTKNNVDHSKKSLEKFAEDGYIDLNHECQVNLAEQTTFYRNTTKIISQAGVQNGSQVSVTFDPAYSKLIFHYVNVIRQGTTIKKLKLSEIKTVHQEEDLKNFIYNGNINAVIILEDVRQGDIIDYGYSVQGFNPIFKGKYTNFLYLDYGVPIYDVYYKLITPDTRKIYLKNVNHSIIPVVTKANRNIIYEWSNKNVKSQKVEDFEPLWYDPYKQVQITEYSTWKEVNDWAKTLFPIDISLSAELKNKINEINNENKSVEEKISATLRFVQDDIRYMGIEMGENSHRPQDPSRIYSQRFGDCKEKSYLFCCMMRAMNLLAEPVLIHTDLKKTINNYLPDPGLFNHVTVKVTNKNETYWFDPTISYQRGSLDNIYYPDYQTGLVISELTKGLTQINFNNISSVHVTETFKVEDLLGEARLTVNTKYFGEEADNLRYRFINESNNKIKEDYQRFYATYYEDIKVDSVNFTDNEMQGNFTVNEYYTLPQLWYTNETSKKTFSFFPYIISNIMRKPKDKKRTAPINLYFPVNYYEEIIVVFPEQWDVTESEMSFKTDIHAFNSKFFESDTAVHLKSSYIVYKDHVPEIETSTYFKNISEFDDNTNFELTYGANSIGLGNRSTNKLVFSIIMAVILIGIFWLSKKKI